jgi:probable rRNA maturation factor
MPRYDIQIANEQNLLRVNRPRLTAIAESTLRAELVASAEISIALVDDPRIHEINREFLKHDYPTDVISFLLESEVVASRTPKKPAARAAKARAKAGPAGAAAPRGAGRRLGGEIIISTETAARLAADYDWRPIHEVSLYLVHGLLHLCGYDDLTPEEQVVMRAREIDVLRPWKITPHYAT